MISRQYTRFAAPSSRHSFGRWRRFWGLQCSAAFYLALCFCGGLALYSKDQLQGIEGSLILLYRLPRHTELFDGLLPAFDQYVTAFHLLTVTRMLERIQLLMETLSQISNDIAHALRTPLSRLRHKLETALIAERNSESKQTIDAALMEPDTILDTFSALLRIAQIESGTRTAG